MLPDLLQGLSDEKLAELIAQGDQAAFELLVTRHRRVLVNHCAQLVGRADAEEAVQEALLRAYLSLSRGHSVQRVSAWLRTIAHNTALNLLRARATRPVPGEHEPADPASDPFERREHLQLVLDALGSLPDRQREALVMRELEGRSYAEIESRLSTSNGAVRQLLNRARARVRTRMGTLAGLEPALRWILGNGSAGSSAVRLGALGGGCAVTVKLCAAALLPASLGSGVVAPRAALPAQHLPAHAATARTTVQRRQSSTVAVSSASQTVSHPAPVFVDYHPVGTSEASPSHPALRTPARSRSWTAGTAPRRDCTPTSSSSSTVASQEMPNVPSPPDGSATSHSRPDEGTAGSSARPEDPGSVAP
ncbi:MAG TPA: sigma-70 family RNA polymerase sigma factor [Solirubrobacteraceae bacterium]|nr:sigma-70 family RNA polymerase sigma factor [Solirubrobacteraceae bacterium]